MDNEFSRFHPIVQFLYFFSVILFTMFIREPFFLGVSFLISLVYAVYLGRKKAFKSIICFLFPMFLLIALINPLFNHGGVTIMAYFPDGNPFTLESLIYGAVSGFLFSSTMMWCMCLRYTMTSDKVIYLFGRVAPKLSLLISMILRFIPKLSEQFRQVRNARHCIGKDINDGSPIERLSNTVRILSSMIQWSMENSIDTADSLKSRGYGLPNRTSFSLFHIEKRDVIIISLITVFDICMFAGYFRGTLEFDYFPMISELEYHTELVILYAVYIALCIIPLTIDIREDRKWKLIQSKI